MAVELNDLGSADGPEFLPTDDGRRSFKAHICAEFDEAVLVVHVPQYLENERGEVYNGTGLLQASAEAFLDECLAECESPEAAKIMAGLLSRYAQKFAAMA